MRSCRADATLTPTHARSISDGLDEGWVVTVWFTSDHHFGHVNVIGYCSRPFRDIAEHDAELARRWNACVQPSDEVWHLGDLAFLRLDRAGPLIERLHGRINLVRGNHDSRSQCRRLLRSGALASLQEESVVSSPIGPLYLRHAPNWTDSDWPSGAAVQACGHVHQHWKSRVRDDLKRIVNVGVDQWAFAPVSMDELIAEAQSMLPLADEVDIACSEERRGYPSHYREDSPA